MMIRESGLLFCATL